MLKSKYRQDTTILGTIEIYKTLQVKKTLIVSLLSIAYSKKRVSQDYLICS